MAFLMGVGAENAVRFQNMGLVSNDNKSCAIFGSSQDCFLGSFFGVEDTNMWRHREIQHNNTTQQLQYQLADSCGNNIAASSSSTISVSYRGMEMMQYLNSEFEKQRLEMDWLLQQANKRLSRLLLEEQSQKQALLIHKLQSRINLLLQQKDQELAVARNRTLELQHLLDIQEIESQMWQKKSNDSEAVVFELNNKLNQLKEANRNNHLLTSHNDDTLSCCDSSSSLIEEQDSEKRLTCKLCQARRSCVVLFPCRDVICCKNCEPLLRQCPVCGTVKESTLEVLLV